MFFLKVMDVDRIVNPTIINNLPQFKMEVEFIDDWSVDSQNIFNSLNLGFLRDLREYDIAAYPGVILRLKLERMLT